MIYTPTQCDTIFSTPLGDYVSSRGSCYGKDLSGNHVEYANCVATNEEKLEVPKAALTFQPRTSSSATCKLLPTTNPSSSIATEHTHVICSTLKQGSNGGTVVGIKVQGMKRGQLH